MLLSQRPPGALFATLVAVVYLIRKDNHFVTSPFYVDIPPLSSSQHWPLPGQYVTPHMNHTYLGLLRAFNSSSICTEPEFWCGGSVLRWNGWSQLKIIWDDAKARCHQRYSSQVVHIDSVGDMCDSLLKRTCNAPRHVCLFGWTYVLGMEFHVAGAAAVRIAQPSISDWTEIINAARDIHWAIYHGAVGEAVRLLSLHHTLNQVGPLAAAHFCRGPINVYMSWHCAHAIGHGAGKHVLSQSLPLDEGARICRQLNVPDSLTCVGGLDMQVRIHFGALGTLPGKSWGFRFFIGSAIFAGPLSPSSLEKLRSNYNAYQAYLNASPPTRAGIQRYRHWSEAAANIAPCAACRGVDSTELAGAGSACNKFPACALLLSSCRGVLPSEAQFVRCVASFVDSATVRMHIHRTYTSTVFGMDDLPLLGSEETFENATQIKARRDLVDILGTTLDQRSTDMCHLGEISCRAQYVCTRNPGFMIGYKLSSSMLPTALEGCPENLNERQAKPYVRR